MSRIVLVQPHSGARISGGYLYNAQLSRHGAWELVSVARGELERTVAELRADVLLADSIWLTEDAFGPFLAAAAAGRRVGVVLHALPSMIAAADRGEPPGAAPSEFELHALESVGLAIAPGRYCADMLRDRAVEVCTVEPGVEPAWRLAPRPRKGPCQLVSLGALTPLKGFLDVLDALAPRAHDPAFRWTLIGSSEAHPAYAREVAERARSFAGVTLAGQLAPELARARVQEADVLVMPSYVENQPLVVLEAMAASVPAVVYAAGAVAHMIEHGREGLIGPVGDRDALARNLARLIDDEAERARMAEACWQRQRSLPTWQEAALTLRRGLGAS